MAADCDAGDSGPLSDRLVHKVWKVRLQAYEELANLFEEAPDGHTDEFRQYGPLLRKFVVDSNAAAQEKALMSVAAFIDNAEDAGKFADGICAGITEKCLSGRPGTRTKAEEIMFKFVEIEQSQEVLEALISKGFTHKTPKVAAAAIAVARECLRLFGASVVNTKPLVKASLPLFDHADKNIRAEAFTLTVELYRWLGPAIQVFVDKLRSAQQTDLKAAFDALPEGNPEAERFTRSAANNQGPAEQEREDSDAEPAEEQSGEAAFDPADLMEPVEVASKITDGFLEKFSATKWLEKKEQLEALIKMCDVPKIVPGDFQEVTKVLKKLLGDSNVVVVAHAVKAMGALANGLRTDFKQYAKFVLVALLDKFKEKKAVVVQEIHTTLDIFHQKTLSLSDIVEDLMAALTNKVPAVRQNSLLWGARVFDATKEDLPKPLLGKLCEALGKMANDPTPDVREATFVAFGSVMSVVGETPCLSHLEKLDKMKQEKVREHFKPRAGASKKKPAASTATPAPVKAKAPAAVAPKKTVNPAAAAAAAPAKPPSRAAAKPAASTSKRPASASTKKAAPMKATEPENVDLSAGISVDEAVEKAREILPDTIYKGVTSVDRKERQDGVESLLSHVQTMDGAWLAENAEIIVRFLSKHPGFKESMFMILARALDTIGHVVAKSDSCPKRCAGITIPICVGKIADVKLRTPSTDCLLNFCEGHKLEFVVAQVLKHAQSQKNPKILAESLKWVSAAIYAFGRLDLNVKNLIAVLQKSLDHTNPQVKAASVDLVATLAKLAGPSIVSVFGDVKPALLATVEKEVEKVAGSKLPPPTRTVKGSPPVAADGVEGAVADDGEAAEAAEEEEDLDDLLPRTDISSHITTALLKAMGGSDWKARMKALQDVEGFINDAGKRIEPTVGDLMPAIKARLSDKLQAVLAHTINLTALIATSMGKGFEKYTRPITPSVVANWSDNKKAIRDTSTACVDAIASVVGIDAIVPLLEKPITVDNPNSRIEALSWLVKNLPSTKSATDVTNLVNCVVNCFLDKNGEVRKLAGEVVDQFVGRIGFDAVSKGMSSMGQAQKLTVKKMLEKYRGAAPPPGAPAPSSTPSSSPSKEKAPATKSLGPASKVKSTSGRKTAPAAPQATKKKAEAESEGCPLLRNDKKDLRARKEKNIKWNIDTDMRGQFEESLKLSLQEHVSPALHKKMFSKDFKHVVAAFADLSTAIAVADEETVTGNLDLLLKYSALKLTESNTSVLMKTLEFLRVLFTHLSTELGYQLTDHEGSNFLSVLAQHSGNNKEPIRQGFRGIMTLAPNLYPASKLFACLLDGVKSKNVRARVECLSELGSLISDHGTDLCSQKQLQVIANCVGDRDGSVRSAALDALSQVYMVVGPELYKMVPAATKDPQKKTFMEERFKSVAVVGETAESSETHLEPPAAAVHVPAASHSSRTHQQLAATPSKARAVAASSDAFTLDFDEIQGDAAPVTESTPAAAVTSSPPSHASHVAPVDLSGLPPGSVEALLAQLKSLDEVERVNAMKLLCQKLQDDMEVLSYADALTLSLSEQVHSAFVTEPISTRVCKYSLNTLMQMFIKRSLATAVSQNSLKELIQELLLRLLDENLLNIDDGSQLLRALNLLMLKILENSDRTTSFSVLLQCLRQRFSPKFTELVLKCLLKLTKALSATISEIHVERLLSDIHLYLQDHPPSQARGGQDEMPLRTVKTILNELVKVKGSSIRDHLSLVPVETCPTIVSYIDLMLKNLPAGEANRPVSAPSDLAASTEGATASKDSGAAAAAKVSSQVKSELAAIFKKIGTKETTQEGLKDLHAFRKLHPSEDLSPHLEKTSEQFQAYIHRGLARLDTQEAASAPNTAASESSIAATSVSSSSSDHASSSKTSEAGGMAQSYMDRLRELQGRYGLKVEGGRGAQSEPASKPQSPDASSSVPAPSPATGVATGASPALATNNSAENYVSRLRELQSRYGINNTKVSPSRSAPTSPGVSDDPPVVPSPSVAAEAPAAPLGVSSSVDVASLKSRLLKASSGTNLTATASVSSSIAAPAPTASTSESSVAALRERLARIKGQQS